MNADSSRYMKNRYRISVIAEKIQGLLLVQAAGLICSAMASAQPHAPALLWGSEPGSGLCDDGVFLRACRRNPWNAGWNVNGLRADSLSVSYAEVHGNFTSGGFRDSYEAASSWSAGAEAATMTHLDRISMIGTFSFDSFSGKGMCGPMSAVPGRYPVNVLEFTPGDKTMQTYSLSGGLTADLTPRWRLGGKMEYTGANYTKRKDLRHSNYLLSMRVSPSVMYHVGDFAAGLSYVFGKDSETIDADELGISSSTYYAFLDKGLMYGAYEVWQGSGIHLDESGIGGFPVCELSHGVAVQLQCRRSFVEIVWRYSYGSAGEKQSIWFEFPGHSAEVRFIQSAGREGSLHRISIDAGWYWQADNENVLGQETGNGVTVTRKYGSNRIYSRQLLRVMPRYEWLSGRTALRAGAAFALLSRLSSQMYPYLVSRNDMLAGGYVSGTVKFGDFDILAGISFRAGWASETSRTVEEGVQTGGTPFRLTSWHDISSEYMTAPRADAGAALRYNLHMGLDVEISAGYARGFALRHIAGADRWSGTLKIGYTF